MDNTAVLLLSEVYGTLKGGISNMYRWLARAIRKQDPAIPVLSAVLEATEEHEEDAKRDGVELLLPRIESGDPRTTPTLDWMTFDHNVKYPHLPSKVRTIVGHIDGTSRAACGIKQDRCSEATVVLFIDDIPEDTEQYKGDEKAMGIGKKEDSILKDAEEADVVFSVGDRTFDHFENQFRAIPANKQPQHMIFLPRPSSIFEEANAEYKKTETKVVLCIGRVAGVEKLKGLDLAVEALSTVAGKIPVKLRVRGVDKDDLEATKVILEHCKSANLQITFLPYGTQKDICKDMLQSHLVLMPSRAEPFGLFGLEAIAAGVPVLVSDKSGLADLINKFAPSYYHCIVETAISGDDQRTVDRWVMCIERALRHCEAAFATAASLKKTLLSTRYWEESERHFIHVCTCQVPNAMLEGKGRDHTGGSQGSSSDEESMNYSILRTSESIFDEEVLQDPEKFQSLLVDFREHVDAALPYFKLSCKAKLRVKRRAKHHITKVHNVLFSGKGLKSKYRKMVECFKLFCATLKKIEDGCVLCTLEFDDTPDLKSFLRGYRDGKLSETLTQELITEGMKQEGGPDLYVHVTLLVTRDTAGSMDKELNEAFKLLSIETTKDQFRDIATKLGFEEGSAADAIKPTFSSQLVFDTLNIWRMREGKAATLSALAEHLRQLRLKYLADRILWTQTRPLPKVEHTPEKRGAVGGQEVVKVHSSTHRSVTVDPEIPIIDQSKLLFRGFSRSGGFASVEKAYHIDWKQDLAVKIHKASEQRDLLLYEAKILKRASQSVYVISLLGVCMEPQFAIVMPYMENGSLAELLEDVDVPWALRWRVAHEISMGMTFLHGLIPQIPHGDLKAQNILLDDDLHVKISNLRVAAWMAQPLPESGYPRFTVTHAPPELLSVIGYPNWFFSPTTKSDVYSYGVLLWEIVTRRRPYDEHRRVSLLLLSKPKSGLRPDMTLVPIDPPDMVTVSKLMQKCWRERPEDRPSFDECEEQLRDVNSKSSKEDILDAITYVKMQTRTTKGTNEAKGAGSTLEESEEIPSPISTPTAFKVPQARSAPLLTAEAEASYDAYICYCIDDRDFVRKMEEKLENPPFGHENKGLRLWYAERDALQAMPIYDTVREGIERSRHVVLVLTPEALTSRMCRFEMEYAAGLPPEARQQKVIPVMYKPTDLPSWLKSISILDYAKEVEVREDWFWVKLAKAISNP